MQKFPERLRELRKAKKISGTTLSALCGLSSGMIHKYEHGIRKPTVEVLEVIADYFGVSIDYLIGRTDEKFF